ncbi:GATA transcription factor 23-like [Durio zibethinus]|uniref:GATA transcription factor 23-like n=1 Tax=Durio zibethinus TaxID=66656 RepID=A0A6P6A4L9_DURZI|nr:GATA transcription factor 23-like [Durio zibethinus]
MHILQQSGFKEINRRCVDCNTTRTPLWRGGPAGPRSLCNACGIRYRKKKRALLGLNRDSRSEKRKSKKGTDVSRSGFKILGRNMGPHHIVGKQDWRRKLREEEQAAFLLMALSCGKVYAQHQFEGLKT